MANPGRVQQIIEELYRRFGGREVVERILDGMPESEAAAWVRRQVGSIDAPREDFDDAARRLVEGDAPDAFTWGPLERGEMGEKPQERQERSFLRFLQNQANDPASTVSNFTRTRAEQLRQTQATLANGGQRTPTGIPLDGVLFNAGQPALDPVTGQPLRGTAPQQQALDNTARRGPAVGVPQGFTAEERVTRESFGGLTNPDAMASYQNNTQQNTGGRYQRSVVTDDDGSLMAEDGGPLIDPATGTIRTDEDGNPLRPMYGDTFERAPLYHENDMYLPVREMNPQQRRRLQARMIRAGMAPDGATALGAWTPAWADAFQQVLGAANITGVTWGEALGEIESGAVEGYADAIRQAREQFEATYEPYRAPDPATIRTTITDSVEAALGRRASNEEMATLFGDIASSYRAQYDAARAAAMAAEGQSYTNPMEAIPEDLRTDADRAAIAGFDQQITAEFGTPTEGVQVDPQARFQERFDEMFGGRIDMIEQRRDDEVNQQRMSARAGSVLARLRGGI